MKQVKTLYLSVSFVACDLKVGGYRRIEMRVRVIKKVQVGKDQEKAQSEKDSHSKNRGGKKPN